MILDLRKDARTIRKFLAERVKSYIAGEAKRRGSISAVGITYEFAQRGWVLIHFDNRPVHERDGEITSSRKDRIKLPHWFAVVKALHYFTTADFDPEWGTYGRVIRKRPVTIILPDGTRKNAINITENAYSAILGKLIKEVALRAKKEKCFDKLPKHPICQLDIDDFNGTWAWPGYKQLGRTNRIR